MGSEVARKEQALSNVSPYPWAGLTKVHAPAVPLWNGALDRAARSTTTAADALAAAFAALGLAAPRVALRGADWPPACTRANAVTAALRMPGRADCGYCEVDASVVDAVLADLEKADSHVVFADADFGRFTYVVARALAQLTTAGFPALVVDVARPRGRAADNLVWLDFELAYGAFRGAARLGTPPAWSTSRGSASPGATFPGVVRYDLSLARVWLTPDEVASLGPGNVVLLHGASTTAGRLHITRIETLAVELVPDERWTVRVKTEDAMEETHTHSSRAALQAEVPLDVVVGRVQLTVGEVGALAPGQVFIADRGVGAPVDLVIGGEPIGRGELVDVDGVLGVRVIELR